MYLTLVLKLTLKLTPGTSFGASLHRVDNKFVPGISFGASSIHPISTFCTLIRLSTISSPDYSIIYFLPYIYISFLFLTYFISSFPSPIFTLSPHSFVASIPSFQYNLSIPLTGVSLVRVLSLSLPSFLSPFLFLP